MVISLNHPLSSIPPLHVDMQAIRDGSLQVVEFRDGKITEWHGHGSIVEVSDASPDATNCYHVVD